MVGRRCTVALVDVTIGGHGLEVADDGRGGNIVPGNGLTGMRERLGNVGGSLTLTAMEQGGTLLRATVPLAA